jgi:hypothetical protein
MMVAQSPTSAVATEPQERRRHQRWQVQWWAELRTPDAAFPGIVSDLSPGGAKVRVRAPLAPKAKVTVDLGILGRFDGRIVWAQDGAVGLRFARAAQPRIARLLESHLCKTPL